MLRRMPIGQIAADGRRVGAFGNPRAIVQATGSAFCLGDGAVGLNGYLLCAITAAALGIMGTEHILDVYELLCFAALADGGQNFQNMVGKRSIHRALFALQNCFCHMGHTHPRELSE